MSSGLRLGNVTHTHTILRLVVYNTTQAFVGCRVIFFHRFKTNLPLCIHIVTDGQPHQPWFINPLKDSLEQNLNLFGIFHVFHLNSMIFRCFAFDNRYDTFTIRHYVCMVVDGLDCLWKSENWQMVFEHCKWIMRNEMKCQMYCPMWNFMLCVEGRLGSLWRNGWM